MIEYLESQNNDDDWINIDVKRSKGGKFYGEVNTFKPNRDEYNQDEKYQKNRRNSSSFTTSQRLARRTGKKKQVEDDDLPPF